MISKDKWDGLKARMAQLGIEETHLTEKFIIGSGKGGQKLHKTASTVYIKHEPTGFEIKCQESRYREDNRYFARLRLCEKLQTLLSDEKSKEQYAIEKLRRQKNDAPGVRNNACLKTNPDKARLNNYDKNPHPSNKSPIPSLFRTIGL